MSSIATTTKNVRYRITCKSPVKLPTERWQALVKAIYRRNAKTPSARYVVLKATGDTIVYEHTVALPDRYSEATRPSIALVATIHHDGMPFDLYALQRLP